MMKDEDGVEPDLDPTKKPGLLDEEELDDSEFDAEDLGLEEEGDM